MRQSITSAHVYTLETKMNFAELLGAEATAEGLAEPTKLYREGVAGLVAQKGTSTALAEIKEYWPSALAFVVKRTKGKAE